MPNKSEWPVGTGGEEVKGESKRGEEPCLVQSIPDAMCSSWGWEWVNHEAMAWLAPAAVYQLGERLRRGASTSSLLPGPQPAGLLGKQEGQAQLIKLWAQALQESRGRREHGKPMWDPLQHTSLFWGALSSSTFLPSEYPLWTAFWGSHQT